MARKKNNGDGGTSGHGEMDVVIPDSTKTDPGARTLNDPSWIKQDMVYKEFGTARPKYY